MGFGGLLHMPQTNLRKYMLQELAGMYEVSNHSFNLCGEELSIYPQDVNNIMGLRIEGDDIEKYLKENAKNEEVIVKTEFFKRYAAANNKLELRGLEDMIDTSQPEDDDFKRAFVLFTIGVILASTTTTYVDWSYIEVVRDVSKIRNFNWGQFTLNHLFHSLRTYKTEGKKSIQGNLALLQFWYWERVISASKYGVEYYKKNKIQPPLMVFWDETNATTRTSAYNKEGIHGASRQNLEDWKNDATTDLALQVERKLCDMEYKLKMQMISQKEEFNKLKRDRSLEDRVRRIETDNAQMRTEIKEIRHLVQLLLDQSTAKTTHVHEPIPLSAQVQAPMPKTTHVQVEQQLGDHSTAHIKRRKPIIDTDYHMQRIDTVAALFIRKSYDYAKVVDIDGHVLTAVQLRGNVTQGGFIADEVINAFVHLSNLETDATSYIRTYEAHKLATNVGERDTFKKLIANKCKGRHLVFVPMHINQNHWAVLVLNFIKKEVQILDSLGGRDKNKEKALVQGIQSCIDASVDKNLVNFETPINLGDWETVSYHHSIPKQEDSESCGAFLIKYMLAWDGEKMADDFTTKEEYFAKNPEERSDYEQDQEDTDDVQILSPSKATQTTVLATTKLMIEVEGNRGEENTAEGSIRRKRGRPRKLEKPTPNTKSVVDQFTTKNIAKQAKATNTHVVPRETTKTLTKRVRRAGPYNGSPWGK
ncbi:hypothetical protein BDA96_05G191500 [Sorghum bicolor]|uniref:Ubiquitin-like protease family profile domain-containing protein n=1 Tax=Sorghum bicolor TaxID=4558 RepID=A0A921R047_SORBI|nr:hypothetical protein BDA96_05G191500 [Sorghum bicolor]